MILIIPTVLALGYAIYSWYWQATVSVHAKYRVSSLIWSLILLIFATNSGFISESNIYTQVFLAAFILMSIVDGIGGLSSDRIIISGSYKRSIKYGDLAKITLIPVPTSKKPNVMAIFTTIKQQTYSLRFGKPIEDLVPLLHEQTTDQVDIEIQTF